MNLTRMLDMSIKVKKKLIDIAKIEKNVKK